MATNYVIDGKKGVMYMTVFGNRILKQRMYQNLTQNELASKMQVSRRTIHAWESCEYVPNIENAYRLCKILKVPFEYLFYFKEI